MTTNDAFVDEATWADGVRNILSIVCLQGLIVIFFRTYVCYLLQVRVWFARLRQSTPPREGWFSAR